MKLPFWAETARKRAYYQVGQLMITEVRDVKQYHESKLLWLIMSTENYETLWLMKIINVRI